MTCRQKLKKERPENVSPIYGGGCMCCPSTYGYMADDKALCMMSDSDSCTKCWDREIPGTEAVETEEPKLEPINWHNVFNETAKVHRAAYDSYRNMGFTDEQAFELVRILFEVGIRK